MVRATASEEQTPEADSELAELTGAAGCRPLVSPYSGASLLNCDRIVTSPGGRMQSFEDAGQPLRRLSTLAHEPWSKRQHGLIDDPLLAGRCCRDMYVPLERAI
jgi:hypothetical protein